VNDLLIANLKDKRFLIKTAWMLKDSFLIEKLCTGLATKE
jgi:hypothetical protein